MKKYLILIAIFLFSASFASAAVTISLDPASPVVNYRDTFLVNVRIETEGECVNAIESVIRFNPSVIKAVDFSTGQSLISLWTSAPKIDQRNGTISFSGGIPGGYCGRIIGDPGVTNLLGKLVLGTSDALSKESLPVQTKVDSAAFSVLLNDGLGTPAGAFFVGSDITIVLSGDPVKNEWLDEVRSDTIAPELFTVDLVRDPNVREGKYFLVWSSSDKQSGIDHYEVLETNPWKFGFFKGTDKETHWTKAESPYIVKDQNLRSKILVKAADKMGNERIVEINPRTSMIPMIEDAWVWSAAAFAAAAGIAIAAIVRFRKRKKEVVNSL